MARPTPSAMSARTCAAACTTARLEGTVVECANHGARFDVTDGGICNWVTHPTWYKLLMDATFPGVLKRSVPSYPTRVEADDVYVEV